MYNMLRDITSYISHYGNYNVSLQYMHLLYFRATFFEQLKFQRLIIFFLKYLWTNFEVWPILALSSLGDSNNLRHAEKPKNLQKNFIHEK